MKKMIYEKPIYDTIKEIDETTKKSILLVGNRLVGKSTVVDNYLRFNDFFAIDCTYTEDELLMITDNKMYKLYHICLIISKILKGIDNMYPICMNYFKEYEANIKIILYNIRNMFMVDNYSNKEALFGKELCEHPELLLDEFCNCLKKHLDTNYLTIVLDDFDALGNSSSRYQLLLYTLLKDRLRTIYVVSDKEVIDNSEKSNRLLRNNDIVRVNYSENIDYVKKILDMLVINNLSTNKIINFNDRVSFLLRDDTIELLIKITNGNILEMYYIIMHLYKYRNSIPNELYNSFIKEYYNNRLLNTSFGIKKERKLHI